MRMRTHRVGATLIELLVVISLIALLISILIPSLRRSMELASSTICKHNLREIGHSLALYRAEHDGWLPFSPRGTGNIEAIRRVDAWFVKLYPTYLPDLAILTCPEDPFSFRLAAAGWRLSDPLVTEYPSYGLNGFLLTAGNGILANVDRSESGRPLDTILAADLGPDDTIGAPPVAALSAMGPLRNSSLLAWDDGFDPFVSRRPRPWITKRHGRGINMLTLTGGVREAQTWNLLRSPMRRYYEDCAGGGCTFCNELRVLHYSFAADHLYWWTGPAPTE